jgi:hypothetical protein
MADGRSRSKKEGLFHVGPQRPFRLACCLAAMSAVVALSSSRAQAGPDSLPAGTPAGPLAGPLTSQPAGSLAPRQVIDQWQWWPIWAREPNAAQYATDKDVLHEGRPSVRVVHAGKDDWALNPRSYGDNQPAHMAVKEGDLLEVSAWVKLQGKGDAAISVDIYDANEKIVQWLYGARYTKETRDWTLLKSRVVIPGGVTTIWPRFTGDAPATVWMEGFTVKRLGNVADLRLGGPPTITLANAALRVAIDTRDGALDVTDLRTGRQWSQKAAGHDLVVTAVKAIDGQSAGLSLLNVALDLKIRVKLQLDKAAPELELSLSADGEMPAPLFYPYPFAGRKGTHLIVPLNEGIDYPADDEAITPMNLAAYNGHGICMAFWGVTDANAGQMAILETPDDAMIRIERQKGGPLYVVPSWESQKGRLGYERKIRYVFFDAGGHVAMCKRYRAYAQQIGLFKTLADKRKANPNVDMLIGAVNTWCFDEKDPVGIVKQMQAAGIDRILWSNQGAPETIQAMNALGVLTGHYDIYQDVMDPNKYPLLQYVMKEWPEGAWPKDLILGADGDWTKGWQVNAKDGSMVPCGIVCDNQTIGYADKRIPEDLKTHPYLCRFLDTTTANPWRECSSPDHPMTRSDSRKYKMELLDLVSNKYKMVCGSETGHDAAVPYVDYFEGMLSLGPYRVSDVLSLTKIYDEVPPNLSKFQVGHQYRLPLWELVYHDCVVAHWYWCDYNNKLPALWDKRDLFNALYGTAPMFMFEPAYWEKNKDRFVRSYRNTAPVARATGYSEMMDHRFLTADRSVQQTTFANGVIVTVNFGEKPFSLADGGKLAPGGLKVVGLSPAAGK